MGKEIAQLITIKELTELKEEVKKEFNEKLEELKSSLAKENISFNIKYSYFHIERAKATLEIYRKLQELHYSMLDWTAKLKPIISDAEQEEKDRASRVNNAIADFKNTYISNKIFFKEDFCKFIDDIFDEYWQKGWAFGYKKGRIESGALNEIFFKEYAKEISEISDHIKNELPSKILELEKQCKEILEAK